MGIKNDRTREVQNKINKMFADRMELACEVVEGSAKLLCPIDLGNLRASINHRVEVLENNITGLIGTNVEYAPYIEFGTGEYAENGEGRKGGWFFFSTQKIERLSVFKEVNGGYIYFTHGSLPQPFLRPALINNESNIKKILYGQ